MSIKNKKPVNKDEKGGTESLMVASEKSAFDAIIELGKEKGHLTFDEITERLPQTITTPEMEELFEELDQLDIPVLEDEEEKEEEENAAAPAEGPADVVVDPPPAVPAEGPTEAVVEPPPAEPPEQSQDDPSKE